MDIDERELTIEELAERVQVPVRTIRFYISEGLVPGPGTRGKGTTYSEGHLLRLQLIRRLAEQRVPLAEQRELLGRLSLEEVQALLAEQEAHAAVLERSAQAPSPKEYISALLHRAQASRLNGGMLSPKTPPQAPPGTAALQALPRAGEPPAPQEAALGSASDPLAQAALGEQLSAGSQPGVAPQPQGHPPAPAGSPVLQAGRSLVAPATVPGAPAPPGTAAVQPPRGGVVWQRWEVAPGVELHVRADVAASYEQLIERLRAVAGDARRDR
jgi:DNA-binding transcriptional MerR regulator